MPRDLLVDPAVVRAGGRLVAPEIPVNAYARPLADEIERRGADRLVRVLRDMYLVRGFETMLDSVKRQGEWHGLRYTHAGPAHLSIGQEAAAVGQARGLLVDDHVFGSHRSHGEVIAKGLAAIDALDEPELDKIMTGYRDGAVLAPVAARLAARDQHERAEQFLLYGLLAEIFAKETGFNLGLGGSMHAFFVPFGIFPNNAIVGGSAPIATGAALHRRVAGLPGITVANIGDAATGCGPVWESFNFAAMGQLRTLWEPGHRGGLPVLFFVNNNFYGMGGQTAGETMGYDRVARVALGVDPRAMHAETVDGTNPLAVLDAVERARAVLEAGDGPVLLDCQTYRFTGHSPSDASSYRTPEEVQLWRDVDPLRCYAGELVDAGVLTPDEDRRLAEDADRRLAEVVELVVDATASARLDLAADPSAVERVMFSGRTTDLSVTAPGDLSAPLAENPRVRAIARKSRSGGGEAGAVLSGTKAVQFRDALFEALAAHAAADGRVILYGEENRDWGGAFGVYRGLTELLPYHRLFNAPISEAAIVGTAVGAAMAGSRPVVELMYSDFLGRAGDEVFNQLAKWQAMSGGQLAMPVVLRISVGSKYGAQHSQDWSAMAAHVPGLQVVYPATPYDAKGLLSSALSGSDPVVFLESQRLYDTVETLRPDGVPAGYYRIPIGAPHTVRAGTDLTVLSVGAVLGRVLEAAQVLQERFGLSAEVIDARSLVPLDLAPVVASVERTGRLVLVSDACTRGSFLQTVAADVTTVAFDSLDAPPVVVGAPNWITPPAELESAFFPGVPAILDAVSEHIVPLPGHVPHRRAGAGALLDRARRGV
ncbi:alpha-ketoacid dehydrogenase subunit alpha/beta [Nakamurella endophytica]|uniref:dihydrolipoyllysine-residue succinyltransferase n=1 Tax=Nakamurella endophytica TaxID=1748367 RepID=A0A917WLQ1_9ACTN|nr:alpha-ketoacid dehydrogenase subunit alpha/beta [Nakamurella endophytica]GGM14850.1 pyruvate dehydrogenase E1 subunit beta [Nakamurella endophytica]